ncbi:hypothetical protein HMPREF9700_00443 [Bergeyella zoohelcum CCUG 30536]|uniref:Uncharacterized protein n=1 Tax=Bergeyella zoohelcum TaxID=1015 RepID=A0A376BZQ3_9FLAO|nr:hypothetical protein HMPREF9700_00443 [Bergeyella zoohelcum CCUG 30536]SSZ46961.1 Uncharacterised protein [Bergeyella zoohelcum]
MESFKLGQGIVNILSSDKVVYSIGVACVLAVMLNNYNYISEDILTLLLISILVLTILSMISKFIKKIKYD